MPALPERRVLPERRARLHRALLCSLCLLLGACATAPRSAHAHGQPQHSSRAMLPGPGSAVPPEATQHGAYYLDDGPGDGPPVDPVAVPDAVPRNEAPLPNANRPYEALGEVYFPDTSSLPFSERGMASWYGRRFHGKRTSSGEPYDMYAMTGAHKTLPIPSYVRVTDLLSGKSVVVRINDRGPFHTGRVIDLSYTAAAKLGYASRGSTEVLVERVFPAGLGDLPAVAQAPATETILSGRPAPETVVAAHPAAVRLTLPAAGMVTAVAPPPGAPIPPAAALELPAPTGSGENGLVPAAADPERSIVAASGGLPIEAGGEPPPADVRSANPAGPASRPPSAVSRLASAGRGLFLQLGAFRDHANARRLLEQARGTLHGLESFLSLELEGGLHRVRLGPFPSTKEQNAAAASVERLLHLRPGLIGQ